MEEGQAGVSVVPSSASPNNAAVSERSPQENEAETSTPTTTATTTTTTTTTTPNPMDSKKTSPTTVRRAVPSLRGPLAQLAALHLPTRIPPPIVLPDLTDPPQPAVLGGSTTPSDTLLPPPLMLPSSLPTHLMEGHERPVLSDRSLRTHRLSLGFFATHPVPIASPSTSPPTTPPTSPPPHGVFLTPASTSNGSTSPDSATTPDTSGSPESSPRPVTVTTVRSRMHRSLAETMMEDGSPVASMDKLESPRRSRRSLLEVMFGSARRQAALRSKLEKLCIRLREYESRRKAALLVLKEKEKQFRIAVAKEILDLRRYGLHVLIPHCRKHAHLELFRLHSGQELERLCVAVLKRELTRIGHLLADSESELPENTEILRPHEICLADLRVNSVVERIRLLEQKVAEAGRQYASRRRSFVNLDEKGRSRKILQLLGSVHVVFQDAGICFFEARDQDQRLFNALFLDERYKEGRKVRHLLRTLRQFGTDVVTSEDIRKFVEFSIVQEAGSDHDAHASLPVFRLFIHRCVFPMIHEDASSYARAANWEKDLLFRKQVAWMRKCTPAELGLDVLMGPGTWNSDLAHNPYQEAISLLGDLPYLVVPFDMMVCILKTAKSIYETARRFLPPKEEGGAVVNDLDADIFIPIFVFVTLHAELPNPSECLYYMNAFASPAEGMAETGYYMACLESAVEYALQITQDDTGMETTE